MKNEHVLQIITSSILQSNGFKIARLKSNRNLDKKAVAAKMASMKKYGMLVPGIIVDAKKAIEAGLEVVDFETEITISDSDAENYVVLVDSNHRYEAYLNLLKENESLEEEDRYKSEFYLIYALNDNLAISKMLAEINTSTNPWKGNDYVKGAQMECKEKLPLLDFIAELTSQGYPLPTASKWCTFKSDITKQVMADAMAGKISDKLRKTNGLERGRRLLDAAAFSLSVQVLKSRNLIDWVVFEYEEAEDEKKADVINNLVTFFKNLDRAKAEQIENARGQRGGDTKETVVNRLLNNFYEEFKKSSDFSMDK